MKEIKDLNKRRNVFYGSEDSVLPTLVYSSNTIPITVPARLLAGTDKRILKLIWKVAGPGITLEKEECRRIILPNVKATYRNRDSLVSRDRHRWMEENNPKTQSHTDMHDWGCWSNWTSTGGKEPLPKTSHLMQKLKWIRYLTGKRKTTKKNYRRKSTDSGLGRVLGLDTKNKIHKRKHR